MAKKKNTMTDVTIGGIAGLNVVGAIPAPASAVGITTGFATGVSNVGNVLPTVGKVVGAKMVLDPLAKLKKMSKKLDFGGNSL